MIQMSEIQYITGREVFFCLEQNSQEKISKFAKLIRLENFFGLALLLYLLGVECFRKKV
jgi:hypothetical protein